MSGGARTGGSTVVNERVRDALDGLSARDLEAMRLAIDARLRACAVCSEDGATAYLITHRGTRASILLCPSCFNHHRLPESRSDNQQG